MVYTPDTTDEIYTSLRDRLTGKIAKLQNFVEDSFNYVWTRAFSRRLRENEVALLASQLSGYVEYAGGPITQDDLDRLGVDGVTPSEVNEYMRDEDLDELVRIVGISRDPGTRATGTVDITTVSGQTVIPAGTQFGTQPDSETGSFLSFETQEQVSTGSGDTSVSVDVIASSPGSEYNVGAGSVTYLPNPPTGVQAVSNPSSITGGVDPESNDELRARAKDAIFQQSGGGTTDGIEGFIEQNVDGVISVSVEEFFTGGAKQSAPYADVIVDGGADTAVEDAIDASHPSGIKHYLVRPTEYAVNVVADLTGTDIDTTAVSNGVVDYISSLQIDEEVYRDKVIQRIMNADSDIDNITNLRIQIDEEPHTYSSGTNVYTLDKVMQSDDDDESYEEGVVEVTGTLNGSEHTFVEDTDFEEYDSSAGDNTPPHDSINWGIGGDSPDDGTEFYVTYNVDDDIDIGNREKASPQDTTFNT